VNITLDDHTFLAPIKLNLYLHITARRESGYHEVDTLIAFTDYGDAVRVEPADTLEMAVDGPFAGDLPEVPTDNLVLRALERMRKEFGVTAGARITLVKNIPVAAGVGGGSSDAATAMLAAAKLWGLPQSAVPTMMKIGAKVGADIPACMYRKPCYATGFGQVLEDAPPVAEMGVLLVNPGIKVSTPAVFERRRGGFSPFMADPKASIRRGGSLVSFLRQRENDLTDAAISLCPPIQDILWAFDDIKTCRLARMSGSGATCFGLFDTFEAAEEARGNFANPNWWARAANLVTPDRIF